MRSTWDDAGAGRPEHLLRLLAQGMTDAAIARQTGTSVRTVQRRIAELQQELGAQSRFQLGVEAARRGLISA